MAKAPATSQLVERIQKLLDERRQHADVIVSIDQILGNVSAALGNSAVASPNRKMIVTTLDAGNVPAVKDRKQRGRRGSFALSAEESILAFVKEKKNPTSAEISRYLNGEGRSASASNALGKLVKGKKLKRTPLGEGRLGSRTPN